jgi:hypothetical protein
MSDPEYRVVGTPEADFVLLDRKIHGSLNVCKGQWREVFESCRSSFGLKQPIWIVHSYGLYAGLDRSLEGQPLTGERIIDYLVREADTPAFAKILADTESAHPGLRCSRLEVSKKLQETKSDLRKEVPMPVDYQPIPEASLTPEDCANGRITYNEFTVRLAHNDYFQKGRLQSPDANTSKAAYTPNGEFIFAEQRLPELGDVIVDQFVLENLIQIDLGESRMNNGMTDFEHVLNSYDTLMSAVSAWQAQETLSGSYLSTALQHFGTLEALQQRLQEYNEQFYPGEIKAAADTYDVTRRRLNALRGS